MRSATISALRSSLNSRRRPQALGDSGDGAFLSSVPQALEQLGFRGNATFASETTASAISDALAKGNGVIVTVKVPGSVQPHAIIVDSISNNTAYIRDPWPLGAGSSYSVPKSALEKEMTGRAVFIKSTD